MDFSQLSAWISQAGTSLADLPPGVHAAAIGVLISGVVLWFCGSKVLKPVLAVAGAATGATLGSVLLPQLGNTEIAGVPSHYVGLGVGAVVGLLGALVLFRFAMAVAGGVGVAVLAVMGAATYLSFTPGALPVSTQDQTAQTTAAQIEHDLRTAADEFGKAVHPPSTEPGAAPADPGAAAKQAATDIWSQLGDLWGRTPDRSRFIFIGAALIGGLSGFLVGQIMPNRAAAVLTSMGGSAMVLSSGNYLARAFDAPFKDALDRGPVVWLSAWAVAVLVGLLVQLNGRKKPEPAKQPA